MRAQASRYRNRLSAVLGDPQARGEYIGGSRAHVGEDGHSLHLGEELSKEESGSGTSPPKGGECGAGAVVAASSTGSWELIFGSVPLFL